MYGAYRLRVRGVEMQKRELERQVNERTTEIKRLFEQTKGLAVIEERNRLARDLHDSAKQKAFAALAELGAARSLANGNREKAVKHLQEAETLVGEVIQEITFLIQEIHPAALKEKGLGPVLREYVFEWGNRTGIHVDLKIEGEQRLPLEIEQVLYRAIQEALANVARHSAANTVTLTLTNQPACFTVSMSDDGQGFDLSHKPNGMGLRSIRERVESVGGTFDIESTVGNGTRLVLQIPLPEKENM
jgi:signal transduction histidine kinase